MFGINCQPVGGPELCRDVQTGGFLSVCTKLSNNYVTVINLEKNFGKKVHLFNRIIRKKEIFQFL